MPTTNRPLVTQELTEFYTGPLRRALTASGLRYGYGYASTGADIDDMAFDQDTKTALIEVLGDESTEAGRVVGHGAGAAIATQALAEFTAEFGAPATFVVDLHAAPGPRVRRDMVARIVR